MYSATAITVMKARAKPLPDHPVLAGLIADNRAADERRLVAERDPDQRAALRAEDAQLQADAEAAMQSLSDMMKPLKAMKRIGKARRSVASAVARVTAVLASIEQTRAERAAQLVTYLHVVVSTLALIVQRQVDAALHMAQSRASAEVEPLLDLDVHSLIAAPRPGPRAGTAPAAA